MFPIHVKIIIVSPPISYPSFFFFRRVFVYGSCIGGAVQLPIFEYWGDMVFVHQ